MAEKNDDVEQDRSPEEHRKQFWKRLEAVSAGMLGLRSDVKLVPMAHHPDPEAHALWFIGSAKSHLVEGLSGGSDAIYAVAEASGKIYARIEGALSVSHDDAKLDEMWNPVAASWFEHGRDDPDVRLLRLDVGSAEVWTTTNGVGFLYEMAKTRITGEEPDLGEHFTVS